MWTFADSLCWGLPFRNQHPDKAFWMCNLIFQPNSLPGLSLLFGPSGQHLMQTWFSVFYKEQDSPSQDWVKPRKLAGRKIIITQSLSNHSGDYRSGHLLCTQSIINQFSFSKVGLVFCASLKTKACCLAVCLRPHLTHILATDGVYNMLTSDLVQFYKLTYFCQQTIYLANEGNARSRQHQCALGLLHDFCLLGCCS